MAWPYSTPTPIRQEMLIDGTWTDITDDTRGSEKEIVITRGYSSQQASLSAGSIAFTLNSADGTYANRNPLSPYYGLLPRNTRHRCSVVLAETSLRLTDTSDLTSGAYDAARAWTADKASLDITGDIDMRIDCSADDWRGRSGHILAAKYSVTGNQRSWVFSVTPDGVVLFFWSSDGTTAARLFARSTVRITERGRITLRVTLDANNGAGGNTATFYTATDGVSGTFTQLGDPVTQTGTAGIFSSTATLEVGTANGGADRGLFATGLNLDPFCGKIYAFQLRSSIGGTIVASMAANAQARGTTSWSDGLAAPNTWTLEASAEITDADYRFHSEIPELPAEWDPSGRDVYVSITAPDVVERLTAGQKPLNSPIFRNLSRLDLDGYWPMEDGIGADRIGAYVGQAGFITDGSFGTAEGLNGSAGALSFTSDSGYASGGVENSGAASGTSFVSWYFKMAALPAGTVEFFNSYYTGGSVYRAVLSCSATTFTITIQDSDYTNLVSVASGFGAGATPTQWMAMRLLMTQSGGTVSWALAWYPVASGTFYGISGTFSGTFGKPRSWISFAYTGKSDLQLAHVVLARIDLDFTGYHFTASTDGYVSETARRRARRLAGELGIPFWWIGPSALDGVDYSTPMGIQGLLTAVDLLQECANVDGGILYAPRDKFGLAIRSYYSMLARDWPELDYTAKHLSGKLTPRELRDFRNDVTITRTGGASGRYVKEDGPNGTTAVGTYDVSIPRNAYTDTQLIPMAQREVALGTWDELRQPSVQVELHRAALLADTAVSAAVAEIDLGTPFALVNLPNHAGGPDDAVELALGYTETLGNFTRTLRFNADPYGPLKVGMWGSATTYDTDSRWAAKYTTLGAGATSTATSLTFSSSNSREYWSTTSEPYDVMIAGERITVTSMGAVSGSGPYTQTATVTRSVNGIVKALASGDTVTLVDAGIWAYKPQEA